MQLILMVFLKFITDTYTHQMIGYFNRNCPLWIVNVSKMAILSCDFVTFSKNLLVVEFRIVSQFEIERPTFNFVRLCLLVEQFINNIKHLKMLSLKRSLHRQYFMTIPRNILIPNPHILHNLIHNQYRINNRFIPLVYLHKYDTLCSITLKHTFTFVSIENSKRFYFFLHYFNSVSRDNYLFYYFSFF